MDASSVEFVNCGDFLNLCQQEAIENIKSNLEVKNFLEMPFEDDFVHKCGEIMYSIRRNHYFLCTFCNTYFTQIDDFLAHLNNMHLQTLENTNSFKRCVKIEQIITSAENSENTGFEKFPAFKEDNKTDIEIESKKKSTNLIDGDQISIGQSDIVESHAKHKTSSSSPSIENSCSGTNVEGPNSLLQCRFCGDRFKMNFVRLKHEHVQTGQESFDLCDSCKKRFCLDNQLKSHSSIKHINTQNDIKMVENILLSKEMDIGNKSENTSINIIRGDEASISIEHSAVESQDTLESDSQNQTTPLSPAKENSCNETNVEGPKTSLQCSFCDQTFKKNYFRLEHERKHTGEKPFKCMTCKQCFRLKHSLKKHMFKWHNEIYVEPVKLPQDYSLQCKFCSRTFKKNFMRIEHERIHTGERPFKCQQCDKCFRTKVALKVHTESVHNINKPFNCNLCGAGFKSENTLGVHMKSHTAKEKRHKCNHCDKVFRNSSLRKNHESVHTGEKPYQCDLCGKSFREKRQLNNHFKLIHTKERPEKCPYCDSAFALKQQLTMHIRRHLNDRRYECEICGKRFIRNADKRNHQKVHSDEKEFQCNKCGIFLKAKPYLERHLKVHANFRPYKCDVCNKAFMNSTSLKTHSFVHTNVKPYGCKICKKRFVQKKSLKRHNCKGNE